MSEREIFIAAVLISLLLVFSFFFFIHIPLKEAYNSEMAERAKLAETETTIVNFKDAHLDSEAYKKELSDQDARMTAAIPDDLRQGEFLALLEQRAIFSHVELIGVTPETEVKEAEYRSLPLTVEFRITFPFSISSKKSRTVTALFKWTLLKFCMMGNF